jgi:thioredoxin-like negative regulator of GroEL
VLVFVGGQVVESLVGVQPASAYEEALGKHIAKN